MKRIRSFRSRDHFCSLRQSRSLPCRSIANCENLSSYLTKGTQVAVSGKISTRTYDAKDGTKRYVTEIVADNFGGVKLLGGKKQDNFNQDPFANFDEDITPVEDGDMPF